MARRHDGHPALQDPDQGLREHETHRTPRRFRRAAADQPARRDRHPPAREPLIASRLQPSAGEIAGHYDELDHFYREIWGEHVHHGLWLRRGDSPAKAARQLVDLVARHAGIKPGDRVCDAGCGYGATARILAGELGAEVTGITLSPAQFRFASRTASASPNPSYLLGDWLENSLPAASFDSVIAVESSEHMPDKPAFFAQAARVLKPGGRLVVCSWLAKEDARAWESRLLLEPICREGRK